MAFNTADLDELRDFLFTAPAVVPYIDVQRGVAPTGAIAMRHDIDHSITKALDFARWEEDNGFRSSYFVLTTAPYYADKTILFECINEMVMLGHEIGFHNDALCHMDGDVVAAAEYIITERKAIQDGLNVHYSLLGIADHGGAPHSNGEIWDHYTPEALGFEYEAYQLQKTANTYISDNQGRWRSPLKHAQTYMLCHPTWWPV